MIITSRHAYMYILQGNAHVKVSAEALILMWQHKAPGNDQFQDYPTLMNNNDSSSNSVTAITGIPNAKNRSNQHMTDMHNGPRSWYHNTTSSMSTITDTSIHTFT